MPPDSIFSISYCFYFEVLGFDIKKIWIKGQIDIFNQLKKIQALFEMIQF